jgi:hypothetical protein
VPNGYDTRQLADGQHVLAAVGTDTNGLSTTAWLMFKTNN